MRRAAVQLLRRNRYWMSVIVGAIVVHVLLIQYLPTLVTYAVQMRLQGRGLVENNLHYGVIKYAGDDLIRYDNPDNLASFSFYDVSKSPVRVFAVVPREVPYWSVSVSAYDTSHLFVVNDTQISGDALSLVIVHTDQEYQPKNDEIIVRSPSRQGILLIRMLMPNRDDTEQIARLKDIQSLAQITPVVALATSVTGK